VWLKETIDGWKADVMVVEGTSRTKHKVTLSKPDRQRLGGLSQPPEVLLEETFRFLLAREPKESILRAFDVSDVQRYFPDFPAEMQRRMSR